ncbi:MAG: hypothetical protein WBV28_15895 [Terracidiphilus sp.]
MIASTRPAPNIFVLLCSTTAILMTLSGSLILIGMRLSGTFGGGEKFIGEIDAMSIALIFGGIAVALKTIEIRLKAEHDSSTD